MACEFAVSGDFFIFEESGLAGEQVMNSQTRDSNLYRHARVPDCTDAIRRLCVTRNRISGLGVRWS